MGPPSTQAAAAVPRMGVGVCMSDWSKRRDVCRVQPPPRYHSLGPDLLNAPQLSVREASLDLQTRSDSSFLLFDFLSPSRGSRVRMRRCRSEVNLSDAGAEYLHPAAGREATLGQRYRSSWTLDLHSSSMQAHKVYGGPGPSKAHGVDGGPGEAPSIPEAAHTSPSLQAAEHIARGDVVCVKASVYSRDRGQSITPHRSFSHHDVQSILFSLSRPPAQQTDPQPATGASGMSGCTRAAFKGVSLDGGTGSALLLSCPLFLSEVAGEPETKLDLNRVVRSTCRAAALGSCSEVLFSPNNTTVSVLEPCTDPLLSPPNLTRTNHIQHMDLGAKYYQKYFYNKDHQNYVGVDQKVGPVCVSVRREPLDGRREGTAFIYRIILRTSQLSTLRGSIMEDSVPSSSKPRTGRGLPVKDLLHFVLPELNIQSLRRARSSPRVPELLLELDQQELSLQFSVGLLWSRAGSSQDFLHSPDTSSPALDQFLDLLGQKVPLKNPSQLDPGGSQSVYTTYRDFQLIFHISTLPPYSALGRTQPLKKCLHGNHVVMVIFQDADSPPFDPQAFSSTLQQVFVVIRVHRPCSQHTCYSVAVSRDRDVPSFGPSVQPMFPASTAFRDFLLVKIINAHLAVRCSDAYVAMATRCRHERLKQLVECFTTTTLVESSSARFSFLALGGRRKQCRAPRPHSYLQSAGALTWSVAALHPTSGAATACILAVSGQWVALVEEESQSVVFSCECRDVIGWSVAHGAVSLFYHHGHRVTFSSRRGRPEDAMEIRHRLQHVIGGGLAVGVALRRSAAGELGFHISSEGAVANVDAHGFAWQAGLRPGCRLVEICGISMATMTHEEMVELLRSSATVHATVIPPLRDGTPRRSEHFLPLSNPALSVSQVQPISCQYS